MIKVLVLTIMLTTVLCTFAFIGQVATFRGQAKGGSRITGRIVEVGTGNALAAEIGLTVRDKRNITLKHVRASEHGLFEMDDLPAGDVHLTTKLEGYASEHQSVSVKEGDTQYLEFHLSRVKIVQGLILSPTGKPITGAEVRVIYSEEDSAGGALSVTYQWEAGEVKSDDSGSYLIDVHPDREFIVEATHPGYVAAISAPVRIDPGQKGAFLRLSLGKGVSITGEVRDARGNAVEGAQVRLIEEKKGPEFGKFTSFALLKQRAMRVTSGKDGTFRFERVNLAKKEMVILHPKYRPLRQTIDLIADQEGSPIRVVMQSKE